MPSTFLEIDISSIAKQNIRDAYGYNYGYDSEAWTINLSSISQFIYGYGYGNIFRHSDFLEAGGLDFFNVLGLLGNNYGYGIDNTKFNNFVEDNNFAGPILSITPITRTTEYWLYTFLTAGGNRSFTGNGLRIFNEQSTCSLLNFNPEPGKKYQVSYFIEENNSNTGFEVGFQMGGFTTFPTTGAISPGLYTNTITAISVSGFRLNIDTTGGTPADITIKDVVIIEYDDNVGYAFGYEYTDSIIANGENTICLKVVVKENNIIQPGVRVVFTGNADINIVPNSLITDSNGEGIIKVSLNENSVFNTNTGTNPNFVNLPQNGFIRIKAEIDRDPEENEGEYIIETVSQQFDINSTTAYEDFEVYSYAFQISNI